MTVNTRDELDELEQLLDYIGVGYADKRSVMALFQAALTKHIQAARADELNRIELAQQDEDKWSNFCMYDSSDFGNYIAARKVKLQQEGEDGR